MITVTQNPDSLETNKDSWWIIYDSTSKIIAVPEPIQCSGITSSLLTMVVGDTVEEIEAYIQENELIYDSLEPLM